MKIAVDTETTGLSVHQKDVAFLVMAVEDAEDGSDPVEHVWEMEIDHTRRKWADTEANDKTIDDVDAYFRDTDDGESVEWIFHNATFDLHALEPFSTFFLDTFSLADDSLLRLHDTLPLSHVYDNLGTHGLKELGMSYLSERPAQRDEVKEAVKAIRRYTKRVEGIQVGKEAAEDYWLPAFVARNCPDIVESVTPSIAPFLKDDDGIKFWRKDDEKLFTRSRLSDDEAATKDRYVDAVHDYLSNVAAVYGVQDVYLTIKLFYFLEGMIDQNSHKDGLWKTYLRERRVLWQIYQMQRRGIRLKPKKLDNKIDEFDNRIAVQTFNLRRLSGRDDLNPGSAPQMQSVFYGNGENDLCLTKIKETKSGAASCDKEVISEYLTQTLLTLSDRDRDIILDAGESIPVPFDLDELGFSTKQHRDQYEKNFFRAVFLRALSDLKAHSAALGYLKSYRELQSSRSYPYSKLIQEATRTFFDIRSWPSRRDRCLYGNWNASGTGTSRLSSSHPNTQNWSKGKEDEFQPGTVKATIRDIFGPDVGDVWFDVDYSQLQVRIFAYMANDRALIDLLEAGSDTHTAIAKLVYKTDSPTKSQRRACKPITFGTLFGMGPSRVAAVSGIENGYELFMSMFPNGKKFIDETVRFARRYGYVVLPDGSRLNIPRDRVYAAFCYVIQGMEAIIVKEAMVDLEIALQGTPMQPVYQVHDSIGAEYLNPFRHPGSPTMNRKSDNQRVMKKCVEIMVDAMQGAGTKYDMLLPVEVEYTETNLGELKKWQPETETAA